MFTTDNAWLISLYVRRKIIDSLDATANTTNILTLTVKPGWCTWPASTKPFSVLSICTSLFPHKKGVSKNVNTGACLYRDQRLCGCLLVCITFQTTVDWWLSYQEYVSYICQLHRTIVPCVGYARSIYTFSRHVLSVSRHLVYLTFEHDVLFKRYVYMPLNDPVSET